MILIILKCIGNIIFALIKVILLLIWTFPMTILMVIPFFINMGGNERLAIVMTNKLSDVFYLILDWKLNFLKIEEVI